MVDSLLGHIAVSLSAHPEHVATNAPGYVLQRSPTAQETPRALLRSVAIDVPVGLVFRTQATGAEGERPDLIGFDERGQSPLVIEAKFWAGLTDNQPVAYLQRLPYEESGALLFVAPGQHLELLWGELKRRCSLFGLPHTDLALLSAGVYAAKLNQHHYMAITSWRTLLDLLIARLEAAGERATAADVQQLAGLCERMDSQAFLPVMSEELTSGIYRRVLDFSAIVDDVSARLVEEGLASKERLRSVASAGYYGRYLHLRRIGVLLACDIRKWMALQATPLWLTVFGPQFQSDTGGQKSARLVGCRRSATAFRNTAVRRLSHSRVPNDSLGRAYRRRARGCALGRRITNASNRRAPCSTRHSGLV